MTQTEAILRLLRQRPHGITSLEALQEVGSFRLAARIWDLRQAGYRITSEAVTLPNGKVVDRYRLEEQPTQLTLDGVA